MKLVDITGKTDASAHYGNMEVSYAGPVPAGSSSTTHHGDIRFTLPGPPDADIVFDSYHGDFFTDFPDLQVLPGQVNPAR